MLHYLKSSDAEKVETGTEHTPRFRTWYFETEELEKPIDAQKLDLPEVDLHKMKMQALLRKIGRRSVLQKSVLAQLGGADLDTTTVRSLVTLLQGPFGQRWRERLATVWALGCLDLAPGHRAAVGSALQDALLNAHTHSGVTLKDRGRSAWFRVLPPAGILGGIASLSTFKSLAPTMTGEVLGVLHSLLVAIIVSGIDGLIIAFISALCLYPLVLPISYALDSDRNVRVRAEAARALGRLRLPETVRALARASLDLSPTVRAAAEEALMSVLPALSVNDYGRLDCQTVPSLCRLLNLKRHQVFTDALGTESLVVEILEALGKVGDGSVVPLVEAIRKEGCTARIRDTARKVLPVLQVRFRKEQDHRLLLRGSSAPVDSGDRLLRSGEWHAETLPETLLRTLKE